MTTTETLDTTEVVTELSNRRIVADALVAANATPDEVMRRAGINLPTFNAWYPALALPSTEDKLREERRSAALELWLDGWSYAAIGRKMGTTRQAVSKLMEPYRESIDATPVAYKWWTIGAHMTAVTAMAGALGCVDETGVPDVGVLLNRLATGRLRVAGTAPIASTGAGDFTTD